MKNTRLGRRSAVRLVSAAVALTVAFILTVMPVAADTINATDVTIRNSGEQKDDNAIGILQKGDKVTVISKTTDSTGTEWYYVKLENGNYGYVKAEWVSTDGQDVPEEETAAPEENTQAETGEGDEETGLEDDWLEEEADMLAATPVSGNDDGTETEGGEGEDTVADSQDSPDVDNGQEYDPYTDPNAQYNINFSTEEDGTGNWYVYNYDTDKRIRISDLEKLSDAQNAAQKNARSAGMWRTVSCILLILLIAVFIFLYVILRRNDRPAPSRKSRSRVRRNDYIDDDDEEEEEDTDYSWDEEEDSEDIPSPVDEAADDTETQADDVSAPGADNSSDSGDANKPDDVDADDSSDETEEEEEIEEPAPRKKKGGLFGVKMSEERKSALFSRDEEDEEDEDSFEEEEDEDEDFYEEDDEDEDDEEETPRRGGFFGFLKSIFSSDGLDDDYDEEEDDEEDEDEDEEYDEDEDDEDFYEDDEEEEEEELPPVRKRTGRSQSSLEKKNSSSRARTRAARSYDFDEEADYPEDVDLIPSANRSSGKAALNRRAVEEALDKEEYDIGEERTGAPDSGRRQPAEAGFERDKDLYADDDDDMEYSFLSSSPRRGSRK